MAFSLVAVFCFKIAYGLRNLVTFTDEWQKFIRQFILFRFDR